MHGVVLPPMNTKRPQPPREPPPLHLIDADWWSDEYDLLLYQYQTMHCVLFGGAPVRPAHAALNDVHAVPMAPVLNEVAPKDLEVAPTDHEVVPTFVPTSSSLDVLEVEVEVEEVVPVPTEVVSSDEEIPQYADVEVVPVFVPNATATYLVGSLLPATDLDEVVPVPDYLVEFALTRLFKCAKLHD